MKAKSKRPNIPIHEGSLGLKVRREHLLTGMRASSSWTCPDCRTTYRRESKDVAISERGKRLVNGIVGWFSCCGNKFKWLDH